MIGLQRFSRSIPLHFFKRFSSSTVQQATTKIPSETLEDDNIQRKITSASKPLVAAAFASLKDDENSQILNKITDQNAKGEGAVNDIQDRQLDEKIIKAESVSMLLAIVDGSNGKVTRKQALKIVSILAEWSSINRAKLSDFENDNRFLKLCRMLGRPAPNNKGNVSNPKERNNNSNNKIAYKTEDLSTVLGIAGDDEAAKLIASISLTQMVKVMSSLAQKKRRSTPLLRSLAFNISSSSEQLDLKQCADVLYSMASLNFPDSVLTAKLCADIQSALPTNEDKSAAVGSILTSIGLLKYRDLDLLESLSKWIIKHNEICRPQDISAMFLTLATLNCQSQDLDEEIKNKLNNNLSEADFPKRVDWLNHVWALTLLKLIEPKQIDSVLSEQFLQTLEDEKKSLTPNMKMKLLNINAYANKMESYQGSRLSPDSSVFSVPLIHCKSKQILLNGTLDALKNLMSSGTYVKSLVDTKMGFVIDAQCVLDSRRNPLPVDKEHSNAIKVAIMVVDFHDMCHGTHRSISGLTKFSFEMLEKSGFTVIPVPYNEFNTSDKLLKRVQYLEKKFKETVKSKN